MKLGVLVVPGILPSPPPFFWNVGIFIQWKSESDSVRGRMNEGVPHRYVCEYVCICMRYKKEVYTSKNDIYVGSYDFRMYNLNCFVAQTASRTKSTIVKW